MPIDKMFLDPMLDAFRKMAAEVTEKGAAGESYDSMMAALKRMEDLGAEMDDFAAYSAKITTEGLQLSFSNAYGLVLGELNKPASSSGGGSGYDDQALLKQTVQAYRDAVQRLKDGTEQARAAASDRFSLNEVETLAKDEMLIKPIEEAIRLGESGISFPAFLREMIEGGLDKAMEGSAVLRDGLEYSLGWAKASNLSPHHIAEEEEKLAVFDRLASAAPFGVPDSMHFELERKLVEHKYAPPIAEWQAIHDRWESILDSLHMWVLAHTRYAIKIDPWQMAPDVQKSILHSKDTIPGHLKVREELLVEYWGSDFIKTLQHESFELDIRTFRFTYSQQYTVFLLEKVWPVVKPCEHMPADLVKEAEELYIEKRMSNPEAHRVTEGVRDYYDSVFGAGLFEQKFGQTEKNNSTAAPWDYSTFKLP